MRNAHKSIDRVTTARPADANSICIRSAFEGILVTLSAHRVACRSSSARLDGGAHFHTQTSTTRLAQAYFPPPNACHFARICSCAPHANIKNSVICGGVWHDAFFFNTEKYVFRRRCPPKTRCDNIIRLWGLLFLPACLCANGRTGNWLAELMYEYAHHTMFCVHACSPLHR